MPDFERVTRSLEVHLAPTAEQRAFVRGKHAGEDRARWQVAALTCAVVALVVAFVAH